MGSRTVRVALVISTFGSGGAERVLSILANYWAAKNFEVTLITFSKPAVDFYPLRENVRRMGLDLISSSGGFGRALAVNLRRAWRLRRAIAAARPDVVISFEDTTNVLTVGATRGLGLPVIISQRVDPRFTPIGRCWSFLRRRLYSLADAVVVQTSTVADLLAGYVPRERIEVIPNPVNASAVRGAMVHEDQKSLKTPGQRHILSVGRLCRQKGHDLLLPAFARCRAAHPDWTLTIIGEGPERASLERLISELGLAGSVRLPGETAKMSEAYSTAGIFVLPSRFEGFPNALCEAMAHGLAAISFDCPSGPAEIIRPGIDGILVPLGDVAALAAALDQLMRDAGLREGLGARAVEGMRRFGLENVMAQWGRLLGRVRRPNGGT